MSRTLGRLMPFQVAILFVLAAASSAHAVSINVGSASGRPGSAVSLDISLDAMGEEVVGSLNMIELPAGFSFVDCEANPDIDKEATAFSFQPVGCTGGEDCGAARAVVISFVNLDPIPDGSTLYSCSVQILSDTASGEFPLGCSEAETSDGEGNELDTTCVAGAIAVTRAPECHRVSVRSDGGQANAGSSGPVVDATGRCIAFHSDASNLLPQSGADVDTNAFRDVFLYDREAGQVERVSLTETGGQANGPSQLQGFRPSIDSDCTCVAFSSDATNLVAGDTNGTTDVFVRDLEVPTTIQVSVATSGTPDGPSTFPSVSGDCQRIAFQSSATNLVDGDTNRVSDIFVFDRASGEVTRVSTGDAGEANGSSISPAISGDGRCVAFASAASNLLPGDTNNQVDVYVACDGEITCRASVSSSGREGNGISFLPDLNEDGTVVAFKSNASNLVPDDRNGQPDVFVHDCESGVTRRVSVNSFGQEGNDIAIPPSIDGDGDRIAFGSFASNLLLGQSVRGRSQVYVRDLGTMATGLVSAAPGGAPSNNSVPDVPPSISLDGEWIAFSSIASNIVPGDTNQALDAFICAVIQPVSPLPPTPTPTPSRTGTAGTPTSTPTPPIPCTRDTDCPAGQICGDDGFCTEPPPCETDEDCEPPAMCIDGRCRVTHTPGPSPTPLRTCMMDSDCEEGEHCRAMVCVPIRECDDTDPEVDRVNCRGIRETCIDGACECGSDCNLDGIVFGTEISRIVCIAGGACSITQCPAGDFSEPLDGEIMGTEVSLAVLNAGLGCPGEGAPLIFARNRTDEERTIDLGMINGIPGQFVQLQLATGLGGDVGTAQVDVFFDNSILGLNGEPAAACTIAPRIASTHQAFAFLPQVPPAPTGNTRLRLMVYDLAFAVDPFTEGSIMTCNFRIQPTTGPGTSQLGSARFQIGDPTGNEFGASVVGGQVNVGEPTECMTNADCPPGTICGPGGTCIPAPECMDDDDCPLGTRCGDDGLCEPIPCEDDEDCPEGTMCDPEDDVCVPTGECEESEDCGEDLRQACVNSQCVCTCDCDGDDNVFVDELTRAVRILGEEIPASNCPAADVDGDNAVFVDEVTLCAVNLGGCPDR